MQTIMIMNDVIKLRRVHNGLEGRLWEAVPKPLGKILKIRCKNIYSYHTEIEQKKKCLKKEIEIVAFKN